MKKILIQLSILFLLGVMMVNCTKEEIRNIDPMIFGISDKTDDAIDQLTSGSWNGALVGLKVQRLKLLVILNRIETDGYTGDNYTLANPEESSRRVNTSLQYVEFKMDSIWNANIQTPFDAVNENSAGIKNFGLKAYNETSTVLTDTYSWLMADSKVDGEVAPSANDFVELQSRIDVLAGLSALNEQEVEAFVKDIKDKYAEMLQQYADLETDVSASPYFTKAQKALYLAMEQPLTDMQATIDEDLSLETKDQLDLIDRDLFGLVNFVENNYTSPAQKPLVYGEISSITELRWFSQEATSDDWSVSWVLTADIDAAETKRWNDGVGYIPVVEFTGLLDGQYHLISGLYMNNYADAHTGLIGRLVNGGEIRNLGLVNADVIVRHPQGGSLVGYVISGKVNNCFGHGKVGVKGQSGGFIGRADNSEISNCFSSIDVTFAGTGANMAAFAGFYAGTTSMTNSYGRGLVTGTAGSTNALVGNINGSAVVASGVYFDSSTAGKPNASGAGYFNAMVVDLPTANWGDLANFPEFSSDVWEIKTITQISSEARPYLKGFPYDELQDFLMAED